MIIHRDNLHRDLHDGPSISTADETFFKESQCFVTVHSKNLNTLPYVEAGKMEGDD